MNLNALNTQNAILSDEEIAHLLDCAMRCENPQGILARAINTIEFLKRENERLRRMNEKYVPENRAEKLIDKTFEAAKERDKRNARPEEDKTDVQ